MILVAACAFGLESPVKWELKALGYDSRVVSPGRVQFEGDWDDVAKTNLWLRTADRVLIEALKFSAPDFDALFETIKKFEWRDWLPVDAMFPVTGRSRLSQLTSVPAIQRSTKKAIVESLMRGHDVTELPESGPEYRVEVAILKDEAAITIDTTGPSLHKRGYRTSFGEAPIKETLAAAMVMLSVWNPERPLVDPFCGSGTIAIEAALIGRCIPPGIRRSFAWQQWPNANGIDVNKFQNAIEPRKQISEPLQIAATDIDPDVLKCARENAEKAGVVRDIHFQQKSFEELRSKRQYGCTITNPPYGERLSERKQLLPLYQSFPAILQRLPTWSHFLITNVPSFEGLIQKSATRRRKLYNGRIECMYYQFLGPRPPRAGDEPVQPATPIGENETSPEPPANNENKHKRATPKATPAVFGGLSDKDTEQSELFSVRLRKRARHLRRWPTKQGITCFRLYERDIPELPFVVDRYENSFHITEYERPHDRNHGNHAAWLDLMKKTVAQTFEVPIHDVHLKIRRRQAGSDQHDKITNDSRISIVNEGGLKFRVNLSDYVDTGLFLDHRITRQMVQSDAEGKDVLNLFAYTGSFSVYAAAGKAKTTTTVDWSRTYLEWARENMKMNGFEGPEHQFVREGAIEFLFGLNKSQKFDLAVVDPPTFSNSKRTEYVWDVQRDYAQLLNLLAKHMKDEGIVYFSTNFRKFKFEENVLPDFETKEISSQTVPEDFRNKKIHRCWKLRRK